MDNKGKKILIFFICFFMCITSLKTISNAISQSFSNIVNITVADIKEEEHHKMHVNHELRVITIPRSVILLIELAGFVILLFYLMDIYFNLKIYNNIANVLGGFSIFFLILEMIKRLITEICFQKYISTSNTFHGEELLEFLNQWSIAKISILEIINILIIIIVIIYKIVRNKRIEKLVLSKGEVIAEKEFVEKAMEKVLLIVPVLYVVSLVFCFIQQLYFKI